MRSVSAATAPVTATAAPALSSRDKNISATSPIAPPIAGGALGGPATPIAKPAAEAVAEASAASCRSRSAAA